MSPGVPKGPGRPALALRYEIIDLLTEEPNLSSRRINDLLGINLSAEELAKTSMILVWKGAAAIPIPHSVTKLPELKKRAFTPRLGIWKYGTVAEILHVGPYKTKTLTEKILKDYIVIQGYEINGLQEEEYLRGPSNLFIKPEGYRTIIRYPVKKTAGK